jgi:hypothetical protein
VSGTEAYTAFTTQHPGAILVSLDHIFPSDAKVHTTETYLFEFHETSIAKATYGRLIPTDNGYDVIEVVRTEDITSWVRRPQSYVSYASSTTFSRSRADAPART